MKGTNTTPKCWYPLYKVQPYIYDHVIVKTYTDTALLVDRSHFGWHVEMNIEPAGLFTRTILYLLQKVLHVTYMCLCTWRRMLLILNLFIISTCLARQIKLSNITSCARRRKQPCLTVHGCNKLHTFLQWEVLVIPFPRKLPEQTS